MRVDARVKPYDGPYFVFDVPSCQMIKRAIWVDTDSAQVGVGTGEFLLFAERISVKQAKKIELVGRTFLVDPHEDAGEQEETLAWLPVPAPAREVEHG